MEMNIIIYSNELKHRWEYHELRRYIIRTNNTYYKFVPIEEINIYIDNSTIRFYIDDKLLNVNDINLIFILDLGKLSRHNLLYRIGILEYLQNKGIKIINSPNVLLLSKNKLLTYFRLVNSGIPIIPTMALSSVNYDKIAFKKLLPNPIVKPIARGGGINVRRLLNNSNIEIEKTIQEFLSESDIPLFQKFINKKDNCDIRVFVCGYRVLAAMKRCSEPGQVVTNISRGGKPMRVKLNKHIRELAVSTAKLIKGEIITVDIIEDNNGHLYVLEVNGYPRWKGLQQVTDFNIVEKIIDYLNRTAKGG